MPSIVIVDDHSFLRIGLHYLVESLGNTILFEAANGQEFMEKLDPGNLPDIVLMDINMPETDGFEATRWLKQQYPLVHVLAISMYDTEASIIRMLKCGAQGYILKDSGPAELQAAIHDLMNEGFYYSDLVSGKLVHEINKSAVPNVINNIQLLTDRENEFLKLACTEMTYKEIAEAMCLSPRTIDGYRDDLFEKLNLRSRTGLVLYAIKNGIYQI